MAQQDAAFLRQRDFDERGLGAGAEILLHAAEADAVAFAGMRGLVRLLALAAIAPQRMRARLGQHFVGAHGAAGNRALRVLHARS